MFMLKHAQFSIRICRTGAWSSKEWGLINSQGPFLINAPLASGTSLCELSLCSALCIQCIVPGFQSSSRLTEGKAKFSEVAYSHRAVVSLDTLSCVCSPFSRLRFFFFFFPHHIARLSLAKAEASQAGCSLKGGQVVESKAMAKAERAY